MRLRELRAFLLDHCDNAGVWEIDFETVKHFTGETYTLDDVKAAMRGREINLGDKLFFPDFVEFQNKGKLSEKCKAQKSIIDKLKKLGVWEQFRNSLETVQDKEKDKDIELEGGVGETQNPEPMNWQLSEADLLSVYSSYPRRQGKEGGLTHLREIVKTPEDLVLVKRAVAKYAEVMAKQKCPLERLYYFSTFFEKHWREYLDPDIGTGQDYSQQSSSPNRTYRVRAESIVSTVLNYFSKPWSERPSAPAELDLWNRHIQLSEEALSEHQNNPAWNKTKWVNRLEKALQTGAMPA